VKPYKVLVLDLDGTLVDSLPAIAQAASTALVGAGLAATDVESVRQNIGGGARNLIERLLARQGVSDQARIAQTLGAFADIYNGYAAAHTPLYPGAMATLRHLSGRLALTLATAKARPATIAILEHLGVAGLFAQVVTMSEMRRPKPDPDCVRQILDGQGVEASQALLVGDTMTDVLTAANAGLDMWAVSYGYGAAEVKAAGGYLRMIDSFDELRELA
jgi:phosphoglycolate phosphatase